MTRNVAGALIAAILTSTSTCNLFADWVARNGDATQRGYVPVSFDPNLLSERWSTGGSFHQVAIAGNRVVQSQGNILEGFDLSSGEKVWQVSGATFHELTLMDGHVYVATGLHSSSCGITCSEKTYVRSYDAEDGAFRFRTEFASQWYSGWGPVPYDNQIYMNGGYYGGLYKFYPGGGSSFLSLAQYDAWQPAIDQNFIYGYVAGNLQIINRDSLTHAGYITNPDYSWAGYSMDTIPVLGDNGNVYVRHGGRLISFDTIGRKIDWSNPNSFSGQPVYNNGIIYTVSAGALSAIDAATGTQIWGWELPAEILNEAMLLTDSHLFVGAPSGTYAIDLNTRKSVWHVPLSGRFAYSDGYLFINGTAFSSVPEPCAQVLLGCIVVAGLNARRFQGTWF